MRSRSCLLFALSLLACVFAGKPCDSQELEPRAYANTPVGLNFLISGYTYNQGGVALDPSLPLENAKLRVDAGLLAYARSFSLEGHSAKVDIVAPYASLFGTADVAGQPLARAVNGWADPEIRVSVNLFGAPAIKLGDMGTYRQDLIVGTSVQVSLPAGHYDPDKAVNLGEHRWTLKPELGLSKALGRWIFELAVAGQFFGTNDDYLVNHVREQQPIYSAQGAMICSLSSGMWIAVGGIYYTGGRTAVDGVRGNDLQKTSRVGAIFTLPVNRNNSVKITASTGVSTRTGGNFNSAGVAWQYRWGGGL